MAEANKVSGFDIPVKPARQLYKVGKLQDEDVDNFVVQSINEEREEADIPAEENLDGSDNSDSDSDICDEDL